MKPRQNPVKNTVEANSQRFYGENRDYFSSFWLNFPTGNLFVTGSVDWYCQKLGLTNLPGYDRKSKTDIYFTLKDLKMQIEIISPFFSAIWKNVKIFNCFFKINVDKSEGWWVYQSTTKIDVRYEFGFKVILNSLLCK